MNMGICLFNSLFQASPKSCGFFFKEAVAVDTKVRMSSSIFLFSFIWRWNVGSFKLPQKTAILPRKYGSEKLKPALRDGSSTVPGGRTF